MPIADVLTTLVGDWLASIVSTVPVIAFGLWGFWDVRSQLKTTQAEAKDCQRQQVAMLQGQIDELKDIIRDALKD